MSEALLSGFVLFEDQGHVATFMGSRLTAELAGIFTPSKHKPVVTFEGVPQSCLNILENWAKHCSGKIQLGRSTKPASPEPFVKRYYFIDPHHLDAMAKLNPLVNESQPCWVSIVWYPSDVLPTYQEIIKTPLKTPLCFTVSFRKYPTQDGLTLVADVHVMARAMAMLRIDQSLLSIITNLDKFPHVDAFCAALEATGCTLLSGNEEIAQQVSDQQRNRT